MNANPSKPLRFAPLVRVSTEGQAKRGESLRTQKQQITRAVEQLGGMFIDDPWQYSGQEHATENFERKKLKQLLDDSFKGQFDAVMVADASRWSRDNLKNEEGLRLLQKNGVRFFVCTTEHNLFDPTARMFLAMSAVIHQYQARLQNQKSIDNRIERARRGAPTAGKLPYGRTFDKATGKWGIDKEKQQKIVWAAERYLAGDQILMLAKTLGVNHVSLWKTLTRRSGDTWETRYRSKELGVDEIVTLKIPRLLPQSTIDKILKRANSNKTYTHGTYKHKYLLARMVFCAECGYAMFGQTNLHGAQNSYYRHPRHRVKECSQGQGLLIRADELDQAVFMKLFALGGDPAGLEQAMQKALPDVSKLDVLLAQKASFEKELQQVETAKQNLVGAIAKGILSDDDARRNMTSLKDNQQAIIKAIEDIDRQTVGIPSREQLKAKAQLITHTLQMVYRQPGRIEKMGFDERRKLVQTFFDGVDVDGRRLGVYVKRNAQNAVEYTIRGTLYAFDGFLDLETDPVDLGSYAVDTIDIIDKNENQKRPSGDLKQNCLGKCHAHHRQRVHQRRRIRTASRL